MKQQQIRFIFLILLILGISITAYSETYTLLREQNFQDEIELLGSYPNGSDANNITSVYFSITDDQKMLVTYYFSPEENAQNYKIALIISTDSGKSFLFPSHVSGAVGHNGRKGKNSITWDIFADVDELVGDIQVTVESTVDRTNYQKLFIVSKKKGKATDGIGLYASYPLLDFQNEVFRSNMDNGTIKSPAAGGAGLTYISMPFQINIDILANSYRIPAHGYSYTHTAVSGSLLYTVLPNIPLVSPFVGLGLQLSEIADSEDIEKNVTVSTSDLFVIGSILIDPSNVYFMQLSFKNSVIRKIRKWSQFQISIGMKI
jgi:hypothetical protein